MRRVWAIIPLVLFGTIAISESFAEESSVIPDWVKNNAGWWSEGLIGDADFVSGIQFLIANGVIAIDQSTSLTPTTISTTTTSRTFKMGFVPIPVQPLTTETWLSLWDLLEDNSDIVLQHANMRADEWIAFSQSPEGSQTGSIDSADFVIGFADMKGLEALIVIEIPCCPGFRLLSSCRCWWVLPYPWAGSAPRPLSASA